MVRTDRCTSRASAKSGESPGEQAPGIGGLSGSESGNRWIARLYQPDGLAARIEGSATSHSDSDGGGRERRAQAGQRAYVDTATSTHHHGRGPADRIDSRRPD